MTSEPEGVTFEEAYAVDGLWASPQIWDSELAIMYLYGGGYVISSPHARRKLAGYFANASGARALVPRYHLASECPFPSAVEDAASHYRWLLEEGYRPEWVIIAGDSSAGGLAVATMLKLREDGTPLPAGGVPISPWVDLACTGETLEMNTKVDLTATKASLQRMAGQYLHGADPRTPLASPLYADLSSLPPLLVVVGGDEALLDDSVRLARCGYGGREHDALYRGWYATYLPDLLRRDPRSRRGGCDDENVDPQPHSLSTRNPYLHLSRWENRSGAPPAVTRYGPTAVDRRTERPEEPISKNTETTNTHTSPSPPSAPSCNLSAQLSTKRP
jgi:epsilon-lactone hydrolase